MYAPRVLASWSWHSPRLSLHRRARNFAASRAVRCRTSFLRKTWPWICPTWAWARAVPFASPHRCACRLRTQRVRQSAIPPAVSARQAPGGAAGVSQTSWCALHALVRSTPPKHDAARPRGPQGGPCSRCFGVCASLHDCRGCGGGASAGVRVRPEVAVASCRQSLAKRRLHVAEIIAKQIHPALQPCSTSRSRCRRCAVLLSWSRRGADPARRRAGACICVSSALSGHTMGSMVQSPKIRCRCAQSALASLGGRERSGGLCADGSAARSTRPARSPLSR